MNTTANTSNPKQLYAATGGGNGGGGVVGAANNISINNNNNINNISMTCNACNRAIYDKLMSKTSPDNKIWHSDCLKCCECNKLLDSKYFETSGRLYCRNDYLNYFGPSCFGCACKITDEQYFFSIKQTISSPPTQPSGQGPDQQQQQLVQTTTTTNTLFFHDKCFACNYCSRSLQKGDKYCIIDNAPPPQQQQQQPPLQQPKTLMICHEICALKYYSASNNVQSNTSGSTGQASLQANPPAPRAKRGRMKQKRA
jgi:hypothetical protein